MDQATQTSAGPVCLTIAGSDPTSGAGAQSDLRVFGKLETYGTSVVAVLTAQNTHGVSESFPVPEAVVRAQLKHLLSDVTPQAAKCGALGAVHSVEVVAELLAAKLFPLVVDPVLFSSNGTPLLTGSQVREAMIRLLGVATIVTPNLDEASFLAEQPVTDIDSMQRAAQRIASFGVSSVLIKGGHLPGEPVDVLWSEGQFHVLRGERVTTESVHGTGCMLSAAITAKLAHGQSILAAVEFAKKYLAEAIRNRVKLGSGSSILLPDKIACGG